MNTVLDSPGGPVHALRGVSLVVPRGKVLAVVGESGSGKTMLVRSLLGIAPSSAEVTGRVWFDGQDLLTLNAEAMRRIRGRRIAIVLQDPMTALDPVMRIGHQIAELIEIHHGVPRKLARAQARDLLVDVGVGDPTRRARQYPHELSGGMRQRVAIAMALACEPAVLIADEPTSALDVTVQAQILDLLRSLQASRDLTVLLITHDLGIVAQYADEVAVMHQGQVVERASVNSLFGSPATDYTRSLLAAVPRL